MITRRLFLELAAIAGGARLLGCASSSGAHPASIVPPAGPPFPQSILRASRAEYEGDLTVIAGALPRDMTGHVFVVGALPEGDGIPPFTADGMIYRLSFDGGASIKTRIVRTDDYLLDEASAGDPDLGFKSTGFTRMSSAFGMRDFANTAMVPFGDGRLLATYDAGRPWEIDPLTLDVIGAAGMLASYTPFFPAVTPALGFFPVNMATAHPVADADGHVYIANYAPPMQGLDVKPFVRVLRWDGKSEPIATSIVDGGGASIVITQSCHQMQTTRSFVILSDGAFNVEPEQMAGKDVSRPQSSSSVLYVIRKSDLNGGTARAMRVEIPIESAHFLAIHDDDGDRVTLMLVHQNASDPSEWVRVNDVVWPDWSAADPATAGAMTAPVDLCPMGRYVVDATTGAVQSSKLLTDDRMWGTTLWTQDRRAPSTSLLGPAWWSTFGFLPPLLTKRVFDMYRDHPHRVVPVDSLPRAALPGQLLRIDHDAMRMDDSFAMPLGYLPMSPTFVPRANGGPNEGYVVMLTCGPDADEAWIFDASSLARGPICRLRHPQLDIGFSLHSTWMPSLASPSPAYRVMRADDYRDRIGALTSDAQTMARRVLGI